MSKNNIDTNEPVNRIVDITETTAIDPSEYMTLRDLCDELSISNATGRNWVKLGKLVPAFTLNRKLYFSKSYIAALRSDIQSGENKALKSRRNKKYVSGNGLYNSYVSEKCKNVATLQKLLSLIEENKIELTDEHIRLIIADCALHLFQGRYPSDNPAKKNMLLAYLTKELTFHEYDILIDDLIPNQERAIAFCREYPLIFHLDYTYEPKEDVLGLLYISCQNIGSRKANGAYFTPTGVVQKMVRRLPITENSRILDPCCGTGNFLLQLPLCADLDNVYGNDTDPVSVYITRINIALKYPAASIRQIVEHITELDYLTDFYDNSFDFIIGNPPWGYEFSEEEKKYLKREFDTAHSNNVESYDVFIERALRGLKKGGYLSFVLPEAVLNVKAHTSVREIITEKTSIRFLEFLGNVFDGVQCPCLILQFQLTGKKLSTIGLTVKNEKREFTIQTERIVTPEYFSFITDDEEYLIIQKLKNRENVKFLEGNADFALGIVTGNNREYISSQKTADNEMVLRGSDICKYHINETNQYIVFKPESFQQLAPVEMYRAKEKLLYRFICNQLVFAYDDKQTLSLNSCNIVIPKLNGLKIKYILAVLNSSVAQFVFQKEFNSVKVLRSHIENIPIPVVDDATQEAVIELVDRLISGLSYPEAATIYHKLDRMISGIFSLTEEEIDTIKGIVDTENRFLV